MIATERKQPNAGRLDMLLRYPNTNRRYEVEIQLGATDESHIIRTIEYWDIERKRFPQYEHCAVLVAENVTSRFLNVVSLFNGTIPLIAVQFQAVKIREFTSLIFTTVMDELVRGDEDEEPPSPADRTYWEQRGPKATVEIADRLLEIVKDFDPELELNYTKTYISLAKNNRVSSKIQFRPQKDYLRLSVFLEKSQDIEQLVEQVGFTYETKGVHTPGAYSAKLYQSDIENHSDTLKEFMRMAYERKILWLPEK